MLAIDGSSLSDPAVLTAVVGGVGTICAGLGAGAKPLFDWLSGKRQHRASSEDSARDDLLALIKIEGEEIVKLRAELAAAREELRAFQAKHMQAVAEWQEKYNAIFAELAELKATIKAHNVQFHPGVIPER